MYDKEFKKRSGFELIDLASNQVLGEFDARIPVSIGGTCLSPGGEYVIGLDSKPRGKSARPRGLFAWKKGKLSGPHWATPFPTTSCVFAGGKFLSRREYMVLFAALDPSDPGPTNRKPVVWVLVTYNVTNGKPKGQIIVHTQNGFVENLHAAKRATPDANAQLGIFRLSANGKYLALQIPKLSGKTAIKTVPAPFLIDLKEAKVVGQFGTALANSLDFSRDGKELVLLRGMNEKLNESHEGTDAELRHRDGK